MVGNIGAEEVLSEAIEDFVNCIFLKNSITSNSQHSQYEKARRHFFRLFNIR